MKMKTLKKVNFIYIVMCMLFMFFYSCKKTKTYEHAFQNPTLSFKERATELVSLMTLEEKVSQMRYDAPAIDRLGVPQYNWWNECLHGVARAGDATVFPQGIGMGATWDPSLIKEMGEAVSDEARAKYHKFQKEGKRGIYQGLTFWTPNINIFRDPRWGRGQETYGEDPFLTSRIAVHYINGLQGDSSSKYLKVVATAKHFAVHSGPEKSRHRDNYQTSDRDLRETYLPAFEATIKEANVQSIMCAYNRYRDDACCGSNFLLDSILRIEWGFDGYVVSDCWAINDFWEEDKHHIVETPEEAGALAVRMGTDLNCGAVFRSSLKEAVLKEMINEDKLDVALIRLFTARFKLGMFDADVEWSTISYDVVGSEKHYKLSKEVANESMVLLKNEDKLLPLKKDIKSIAVIGPNADFKQSLIGNYHGTPFNFNTPLKAIKEKLPDAMVHYALGSNIAVGWPQLKPIPSSNLRSGSEKGLKGLYFTNLNFEGNPAIERVDDSIDFIWRSNPIQGEKTDSVSVRWIGQIVPDESGSYRIGFKALSKAKVFFNDEVQFEFSDDHEPKTRYFDAELIKGKTYDIKIEYANWSSDSQAHLVWAKTDIDHIQPAIEAANKSDVVVLCLGLSPDIEGEEMPVQLEGFDKGDRSEISLPKNQIELMKAVYATGKPTILVLMNGSALAINWANENIPAIMEAWYPGEFGGKAIADVLFGDYNPGGKLPVTFYKSVNDLPDFQSYDMKNRTYKYFTGEPLYPFGHGLSYSSFDYKNLSIADEISISDDLEIKVDVTNSSAYDGDEVVQVYVGYPDQVNSATRSLVYFNRVHIKAGETKKLSIKVNNEDYSYIDDTGQKNQKTGNMIVSVGGKQPGFKGNADSKTTQVVLKTIRIVN